MLIENFDDILKVRLIFGQIMKFTYHLPINSSDDWLDADIMSKTTTFMHGNVRWCAIIHVEFIKDIASI